MITGVLFYFFLLDLNSDNRSSSSSIEYQRKLFVASNEAIKNNRQQYHDDVAFEDEGIIKEQDFSKLNI